MSGFTPFGFSTFSSPGSIATKVRQCAGGIPGTTCFQSILDNSTITSASSVIQNGSITEHKLADASISENKIQNGAVTVPKLSTYPSYPCSLMETYAIDTDAFNSFRLFIRSVNYSGYTLTFSGSGEEQLQFWLLFQDENGNNITNPGTDSQAFDPGDIVYISLPTGSYEYGDEFAYRLSIQDIWSNKPDGAVTYSVYIRYITEELGTTSIQLAPFVSITFTPFTLYEPSITLNSFTSDISTPYVSANITTSIDASSVGVVWSDTNPIPTTTDSNYAVSLSGTIGSQNTWVNFAAFPTNTVLYGRAFGSNTVGVSYSHVFEFETGLCLLEGTLITMSDRTTKKIENITYNDDILVWDFDSGAFASSKPLWIKSANTTNRYNRMVFSDGSTLCTVNQHRLYIKEECAFTCPVTRHSDAMKHGLDVSTTVFTHDSKFVTMDKVFTVCAQNDEIRHYNIITDYHMNFFANGILTSCRYSNIAPIHDMKYVTCDDRVPDESRHVLHENIPEKYIKGMRLERHPLVANDIDSTIKYVKRLELCKVEKRTTE